MHVLYVPYLHILKYTCANIYSLMYVYIIIYNACARAYFENCGFMDVANISKPRIHMNPFGSSFLHGNQWPRSATTLVRLGSSYVAWMGSLFTPVADPILLE